MDLELSGRVAVVTGASKGIGLAVTRTLLDEGARVVATSRSTTPELEGLEGELVHVPADLMDPEAPAEVVARALETFGRLDVLVNNGGGRAPGIDYPHSGFMSVSDHDWMAAYEFNVLSAVRMSRAALPVLIERGEGAIVNVSSANARQPTSFNVEYSVAKAALSNLTKALAEEFGPEGVRVNGVMPGPVLTPWWTEKGGAADRMGEMFETDAVSVIAKEAPEMMQLTSGRLAEPQEIADAIVLLASPRSASTIGAEFVVDGGLLKTT